MRGLLSGTQIPDADAVGHRLEQGVAVGGEEPAGTRSSRVKGSLKRSVAAGLLSGAASAMSAVRSYRVSALLKPTLSSGATVCARGNHHSAAERSGEGRTGLEGADVVPTRVFDCHTDELVTVERAGVVDTVEAAHEIVSGAEVEDTRFVGVACPVVPGDDSEGRIRRFARRGHLGELVVGRRS